MESYCYCSFGTANSLRKNPSEKLFFTVRKINRGQTSFHCFYVKIDTSKSLPKKGQALKRRNNKHGRFDQERTYCSNSTCRVN